MNFKLVNMIDINNNTNMSLRAKRGKTSFLAYNNQSEVSASRGVAFATMDEANLSLREVAIPPKAEPAALLGTSR